MIDFTEEELNYILACLQARDIQWRSFLKTKEEYLNSPRYAEWVQAKKEAIDLYDKTATLLEIFRVIYIKIIGERNVIILEKYKRNGWEFYSYDFDRLSYKKDGVIKSDKELIEMYGKK